MASAQKTLIDIASVSQQVVSTLDRCVGRKTVESLRLDKIVVGSRIVLEALNKALLFKEGNIDDRLVDWLHSDEPQACLRTLNQMEEMLNRKVEYGVKSFFKTSQPTYNQDKNDEAIKLFQMRKSYFHFLLTTGIWNREDGAQQQPRLTIQHALHINKVLGPREGLANAPQPMSGNSSCVARARRIGIKEGRQEVNLEKLDGILGWLNAWNSRATHERTLLLRQRDTCVWLPKTSAYKKWRNKENTFLWLHGKAGAGKSVLVASVIDDLQDTLLDDEVLAYFYCDFRDERSTSAAEMLRSLLCQLLRQYHRHMVNLGGLIDELVEERDGGASTLNNVTFLTRHVSRIARQFHEPPFLVIDALDECKDVKELLDALIELQKGGVRLLAVSRPLQVIKESFSGLPFIDMETMSGDISADIRLHVTKVLDSHRRLRIIDASLKDEILSALCEKACGMFRWAQCQLNTLEQCVTAVELREALINLPDDLDGTYGRVLSEIDKAKRGGRLARRALAWLVVALGPLRLSQIMEGLAIDLQRQALDRDSGPVHGSALLDALGSLVMHDEMTDIVILSHFSVKEYLMAESTRNKYPKYHIDKQTTHTQIALLCMCWIGVYLRRDQQPGGYEPSFCASPETPTPRNISNWPASRRKTPHISLSESHPLFKYVLSRGFDHLAYVNSRNKAILRAIKKFQMDAEQHPSQWKQLLEGAYPWSPHLTPEHDLALSVLVASASNPLLCSFIGSTRLQLKDGTNPLIYAASFGKIEHAKTLLSKGADVNCKGWAVQGFRQLLPLEVAIEHWDYAMVDLFLRNGTRVPDKLFASAFMKSHCSISPRILSRLLQTDEFVEWAIKIQDSKLLLRALDQRRHLPSIDDCLSEQDIDINIRRLIQFGHKPPRSDEASIRYAVSRGHISFVKDLLAKNTAFPPDVILDACRAHSNSTMIRLLLDMGSDANVTLPNGDTPLHLVLDSGTRRSEGDRLESVKVLVGASCSPCAYNLAGDTPLHIAVRSGHIAVVEYLLMLHIPLPPNILLVESMSKTAAAMIRLLIHEGADVHAIAANGDTPLHTITGNSLLNWDDRIECASILISAGCNPCIPNASGETVLDVAARGWDLSLVRYLLSMSVPFQPGILLSMFDQFLPSTSMIKILIDHGADVHVRDPDGRTLLHLAMIASWTSWESEPECLDRVKFFVDTGCDPCACDARGETPFYHAASRGYILVMEYLLSLGVPVPSDIMLSQFEYTISPMPQRYCSAIRFLLDKGGDIHTISEQGDTLLHWAANCSQENIALEISQLLVDAGFNLHVFNSKHQTPLHIAARKGYVSVIGYYLSLGISLPPDILLAASKRYSPEMAQVVRYLIAKGADVSVVTTDALVLDRPLWILGDEDELAEWVGILTNAGCNFRWETLLRAAARDGCIDVLNYCLSQGVHLPPDILLISAPHTIHYLVERGTDITYDVAANADTELMHRTLDYYDEECCLKCAKIFVDSGWNLSSKNAAGETPIHIAVKHEQLSTIKYLLAQNVPLPSDALLAAPARRMPIIHFLIREGASVNAVTPNGDTPLHFALRSMMSKSHPVGSFHGSDSMESWKFVKVLLDCGADPSARNADGQTSFDIAEAEGKFFQENFRRLVCNARSIRLGA